MKLAADCLLEMELRREYDAGIMQGKERSVEVWVADIPGALVLLQECGEMEKVLEYGTSWLNSNAAHPSSKDVALAMALAYCDLASAILGSEEAQVTICCEHLETAVDLLDHFKVETSLRAEIMSTLKELRPQYILEQFAISGTEGSAVNRSKAMKQLKALVWEVDEELNLSPFLDNREQFLQQARQNLTAVQQIELYESAPKHVSIPLMELYDTALAYVAAGYHKKWPQYINAASTALQKIQVASMTGADPDAMDVSVELGLCALLMGESEKAMNFLGLTPNANKLPNEDVLEYVKEHSPSEDDLLPGVCALAERWLKDTIIPNYKEMNTSQTSLEEWFQSRKVSMYLQVLERGKELSFLSAASATMKLSSSMAQGISSAVSKSFSRIKGIVQRKPRVMEEDGVHQEKRSQIKMPKLPVRGSLAEDAVEVDDMEELRRMNSLNGASSTSDHAAAGVESVEVQSANGVRVDWESHEAHLLPTGGSVLEEADKPVSKSDFFGTALFKGLVAGGTVLMVAALGAAMVNQRSYPLSTSSSSAPFQRFISRVQDIFVDTQGTLDVPLAEELLHRWHGIKAEALGASHDTEHLADILEGNMLKQWRDRAQYVKQDGWHWRYKILDLSVDKVSVARDGRKATIEAHIKERAELIDQGRKADWYSTSYSVQYELSMRKQGWKISAARVVYESK